MAFWINSLRNEGATFLAKGPTLLAVLVYSLSFSELLIAFDCPLRQSNRSKFKSIRHKIHSWAFPRQKPGSGCLIDDFVYFDVALSHVFLL